MIQSKPKTAILLHTFDNRGPTWETAVWGTPTRPGRIPTAVAAAIESGAELLMIFSENMSGENTGALIRDYLFAHIEELPKFAPALPVLGRFLPSEIRNRIGKIFLLSDVLIENTADEVRLAPPILRGYGIEHVVFVSNVDHISRIAQLVGALWIDKGLTDLTAAFRPAMSMHSQPGATMQDVVVFEPPAIKALGELNPRRLLGLRDKPDAIARISSALTSVGA